MGNETQATQALCHYLRVMKYAKKTAASGFAGGLPRKALKSKRSSASSIERATYWGCGVPRFLFPRSDGHHGQSKFAWLRKKTFRSKQADQFHRPKLRIAAALAHGHSTFFICLAHSNITQTTSTTLDMLTPCLP